MTNEYITYAKNELQGKDYVELRLGKHRKKGFKEDSLYIKPIIFELFEDIIWSKYREYSSNRASAITTKEWGRILEGFHEVIELLKGSTTMEEVKKILKIRSHIDMPASLDETVFISNLIALFESVSTWLETSIKDEEFITICG